MVYFFRCSHHLCHHTTHPKSVLSLPLSLQSHPPYILLPAFSIPNIFSPMHSYSLDIFPPYFSAPLLYLLQPTRNRLWNSSCVSHLPLTVPHLTATHLPPMWLLPMRETGLSLQQWGEWLLPHDCKCVIFSLHLLHPFPI